MRRAIAWLRRIPLWWGVGGVVALLLVAGFLVWFFFLRSSGPAAVVQTPPARPALGKVVTFADYRKAVRQAQSDLGAARSSTGNDRKKAIQKVAGDLESVEGASVLPPGPTAKPSQVDNTLILVELKASDPNLTAVDAALSALGESLDAASKGSMQGVLAGQPAIDALNKVLSDPIFDYTRDETPLQKLARWLAGLTGRADPGDTLWRWFLAIMAGLSGGALTYLATDRISNRWLRLGVSVLGGIAVAVIFLFGASYLDITIEILAAAGLGVAALALVLVAGGLNRASSPASVRAVSELEQVLGMSASEARRRAEEAASAEDYRSAIRYRCLAVLLALDEAGMLTFDRTATNREYLFRAPGTIHDDLQPLLDRFDQIWYGDASTNAEEWADYSAKAGSIEARVATEIRSQAKAA
jgi:Domain of unknown function (DUF4129)